MLATASLLMSARAKAFSSEVGTGSREENASNQESRAPFRFNRNGKGSRHRPQRFDRGAPMTAIFIRQGHLLRATEHAGGPWSPDMLQGSATTALMAREVERLAVNS